MAADERVAVLRSLLDVIPFDDPERLRYEDELDIAEAELIDLTGSSPIRIDDAGYSNGVDDDGVQEADYIDLTKEQIRNDEIYARNLEQDINSVDMPSIQAGQVSSSSAPSSSSAKPNLAEDSFPTFPRTQVESILQHAMEKVSHVYYEEESRPANFFQGAQNMLNSILNQSLRSLGAEGAVDAVNKAFEVQHGSYKHLPPIKQKELAKAWRALFIEKLAQPGSSAPDSDEITLTDAEMSGIRIRANSRLLGELGPADLYSGERRERYDRRRQQIINEMVEDERQKKERLCAVTTGRPAAGRTWTLADVDAEVTRVYGPSSLRSGPIAHRAHLLRQDLLRQHFDGRAAATPTTSAVASSSSPTVVTGNQASSSSSPFSSFASAFRDMSSSFISSLRSEIEKRAERIYGRPERRNEYQQRGATSYIERNLRTAVEEHGLRQHSSSSSSTKRPFYNLQDFRDISAHVDGMRGSSTDNIVDETAYLLGMQDRPANTNTNYDYLQDRYGGSYYGEQTKEDLRNLVENIMRDIDVAPEDREGTPDAMTYPLMEHQKVGLAWMRKMEDGANKGGLLGDEMGLGKTIQSLALIVSHPSEDQNKKTTLIVGPVALLKQWYREIEGKIKPAYKQTIFLHHGVKKASSYETLAKHDIVLTTYGTIASELRAKVKWEESMKADPRNERNKPDLLFLGEGCDFYRVILDEAQYIKNKDTQSAKGCCQLSATYRWALSGTPAQNNIDEFYSIVKYLRIKPYCVWDNFRRDLSVPTRSHQKARVDRAMQKVQALLRAIMLRRTKNSKIDGRSILQLPPKTVEIIHAVFSDDEKEFYQALETRSQVIMSRYMDENEVGRHYANILVLLLRLRQACCHPKLIQHMSVPASTVVEVQDKGTLVEMAKALAPEVVERLRNDTTMECPVCYDAPENATIILYCGHYCCSECIIKLLANQRQQNEMNDMEQTAACPQCRGELSTKKTIDYETFKAVHMAPQITEDPADDTDEDLSAPADDKEKGKEEVDGKGKEKAKDDKPPRRPPRDDRESRKADLLESLRENWISSAKIDKCLSILQSIREKDSSEKTIVFSQFVLLLDFIGIALDTQGVKHKRYDGSMSANARDDAVTDFTNEPDSNIMLVSLKAGNVGLNLVAASQCIIMDPFWNPFVEYQAVDRTHRIGQLRPVVVHRICIKETVEDRILSLQEDKRVGIENAMDENAGKTLSRLSQRELGFLFGLTDMSGARTTTVTAST